jgi:molybdopterin synthase sulfur carrier subunit
MQVNLQLFGVYRRFQDIPAIELTCADDATIADVKEALGAYAAAHWDGWHERILRSTVLASEEAVLRNDDPVPANGRLAILPPVSGG